MSDSQKTAVDLNTAAQRQDHQRILAVLHRQCEVNGHRAYTMLAEDEYAARAYGFRTTIGDIATATGLSEHVVAAHLRDAHLVVLEEDAATPVGTWGVMEDGE